MYEAIYIDSGGRSYSVTFSATGNPEDIWMAAQNAMQKRHGHRNVTGWHKYIHKYIYDDPLKF